MSTEDAQGAPAVLDSLTKAGYDTTAIRTVRNAVQALVNPPANPFGGGRGGGGGGGRGAGGQACEHPTTQWETFCARPAEVAGGGRRGGAGADSAAAPAATPAPVAAAPAAAGRGARGRNQQGATGDAALDPVGRIWSIIGMTAPAQAGGRGGAGGFGGLGGMTTANTGDYLVTLILNGQSYKQKLRVERVSGGRDSGFQFGEDENHDQVGRYTPKASKSKK